MNPSFLHNSNFSKSTIKSIVGLLAGSVFLFAFLAYLVTAGMTTGFDEAVLLWINQGATMQLDWFFKYFTEFGGVIVVTVATVLLVGFFIAKKRFDKALFLSLCMGGVMVINLVLKSLFDRARPDLWEWIVTETHLSFPSGHATATMTLAMAVIVLVWHTKWRVLTIILASLYIISIGLSRLYLGVHFPTDIIGGWLLGIVWVCTAVLLFQAVAARKAHKKVDA